MQEEMREDLEQTGDVATDVMGLLGESGMCVYVCAEGPRGHESQKSNNYDNQSGTSTAIRHYQGLLNLAYFRPLAIEFATGSHRSLS